MKQKITFFILNLWERSKDFSHLLFYEKTIFLFLYFCELFYKILFFIVIKIKKYFGQYKTSSKVISVGNLSVGGTGKSVFVAYLAEKLGPKGAVLTRGYGRKGKKNVVVDKFSDPLFVGDEPLMLARKLNIPVVVGSDRVASAKLVENKKYFILDDGYQNFQLKKDFEILLLDARDPFGNNHCLPAGPLREKDFSRADVVVFTHADIASDLAVKKFKNKEVFFGRHKVLGLRDVSSNKYTSTSSSQEFFLVAGIGSFSGFVTSCENYGILVKDSYEFPDHHVYTQKDLDFILSRQCDGIVTTSKDWQKLERLLEKREAKLPCSIYVLDIGFEFLKDEEKFLGVMRRRLVWEDL